MHGLNADARTTVPVVGGADVVAGIFFALAPFVECEVLAAHGCFCSMLFFKVAVDRWLLRGVPQVPAVRFGSRIVIVDGRWYVFRGSFRMCRPEWM